jgi:hypothetical protein
VPGQERKRTPDGPLSDALARICFIRSLTLREVAPQRVGRVSAFAPPAPCDNHRVIRRTPL